MLAEERRRAYRHPAKKETRKALELLLQKKDLRAGNADSFLSDIISKMNTGTDASG